VILRVVLAQWAQPFRIRAATGEVT
jgi:hypothetical protein